MNDKIKQINDLETICFVGPMELTYPLEKFPRKSLIFIDGGINHLRNQNFDQSDLKLVGDGDSLEQPAEAPFLIKLSQEKDISDLKAGLDILSSKQKSIYLNGFLGGRLDHQMAVLGETHEHLMKFPSTSIFFSENVHLLPAGKHRLEFKGEFSLFSLIKTLVNIEGSVKYKGADIELRPLSSRGLSNYSNGSFNLNISSPTFFIRSGLDIYK